MICEYLTWGKDSKIYAYGIGSYLAIAYEQQSDNIWLAIMFMSLIIAAINRFLWQPLTEYIDRKIPDIQSIST